MSAIVDRFVMHRAISSALSSFASRLADALETEQASAATIADEPNPPWREERFRTIAMTIAAIARALRTVAEPKRKAKP